MARFPCRGMVGAALVAALIAAGAGAGAGARVTGSADFTPVEAAMRARVREDGLAGGALLVADRQGVLERRTFGTMRRSTIMPIASASKWLTVATVMTLVDEGRLRLDDPLSRHLVELRGSKATITLRQALSHTSGLGPVGCAGDQTVSLASCVTLIARSGPIADPGKEFHYTSVGFVLAARVVEIVTGESFEAAFETRLANPLGMQRTRFARGSAQPDPAGSATSTLDDYGKFVALMAAHGVVGGRRVLSAAAVDEIERDQVVGIDTSVDAAVRITKIPTYGLGLWRDVTGPMDEARVVSGSGAFGFYPWIDRVHDTYGIVAVADTRHGASHAVPASARIARAAWTAAAGGD